MRSDRRRTELDHAPRFPLLQPRSRHFRSRRPERILLDPNHGEHGSHRRPWCARGSGAASPASARPTSRSETRASTARCRRREDGRTTATTVFAARKTCARRDKTRGASGARTHPRRGARAPLQERCEEERRAGKLHAGAVTFVQRFGSSLNLHVHLHTCALDASVAQEDGPVVPSRAGKKPTHPVQDDRRARAAQHRARGPDRAPAHDK